MELIVAFQLRFRLESDLTPRLNQVNKHFG